MPADITAATSPAGTLARARRTHVRWYVLLLISLMYMITYMDRSNISIAAPAIAKEFGFSKRKSRWFSARSPGPMRRVRFPAAGSPIISGRSGCFWRSFRSGP